MTMFDYQVLQDEEREENARETLKRKVMFARRKQELKEQRQYQIEHHNGYCPVCHMLKSMTGMCDC